MPSPIQPFAEGTLDTLKFRIPAILTLNNGNVLAVADMRNTNGQDSPDNIETLSAIWDGEKVTHRVINEFDDVTRGVSNTKSASFIDSAIVQSTVTNRIFIATTSYPSGSGTLQAFRGTGYKEIDGKRRLMLSLKPGNKNIDSFECFVGDFEGEFAPVIGTDKNYSIDSHFNIYLDGEPLMMKKVDCEEMTQQNVFFDGADLHVFSTAYLILKYSDDNGETWSAPVLLNENLKKEDETFFGICPGRGAITTVDGKERIMFCAYYHTPLTERVSIVYSDDNGSTWHRTESLSHSRLSGKSSESQIINCPDGSLKIFSRNNSRFIATAKSVDGGLTWTKLVGDRNLYCTKNCMVSFITTDKTINNKQVVLGSFAHGGPKRADGVIRTGLMSEKGDIEWIKTYHINKGFFAYSCLTELQDGNIACLYEDDPARVTLGVFSLDSEGNISSVYNDDIEYDERKSKSEERRYKLRTKIFE